MPDSLLLRPQIWSGDGEWYAASIIGVSAAGSFVVSFDEDGGTEEVNVNSASAVRTPCRGRMVKRCTAVSCCLVRPT